MTKQGPYAAYLNLNFILFIFVNEFGPSQKIVGQIKGVFSFAGTLGMAPSPGWPHPKENPATAPASDVMKEPYKTGQVGQRNLSIHFH